jgi:mRNA interferase RelE/StbE
VKLDISKPSLDFVLTLDAKRFRQVMRKVLMLLSVPRPNDAELLKGYDDVWKTDIGEFRIIYRFDQETIEVYMTARRNDDDVYRAFDRMMR